MIIETRLLCPRCKTCETIFRNMARRKELGHYKKMYCYKCKTTHNHIEIRTDYNYTDEELDALIEQMKQDGKYNSNEEMLERLKRKPC